MSKKPAISKEAQVLLKLLRIALGTEPRKYFGEVVEPFPEGIDWKEVVRLSYEHKVSAIAVDGLEASKYDPYKGLDEKQTQELKAVLVPWIKDVENTEWSYCYYVEVLKTLCQIFKDNGLTPIILKGYGLSLNYPRPSHRGAGDIDVFLVDEDGKPAAERGVEIVEKTLGIKTKKVPHDYEFEFKGLEVELHYEVTNAYWESESESYTVERLRKILVEGCHTCPGIEGALLPSANFNAVYLMRHMYGHFYTDTSNLRQLIDLMLVFHVCFESIDMRIINYEWKKSGMKAYADAVMCILSTCFKYSVTSSIPYDNISENNRLVLSGFFGLDIKKFYLIPKYKRKIAKIKMLYNGKWISFLFKQHIMSLM